VPTILIVDDTPVDRHLAGRCVEAEGYQVRYALNGCDALRQIEQQYPDLVLTDLVMPEMDGLQLVTRIRKQYPDIPVILMTAYGTEDTSVQALEAGAASYVPKRDLKRRVGETIRTVLFTVEAAQHDTGPWTLMSYSESHFLLGYEPHGRSTMIGYFEEELTRMNFCDATDRIRVGTALTEALANAVEHGNLELDSNLRESTNGEYYKLGETRSKQPPYCERRVRITTRVTPSEVTYVIRDEGPGFQYENLPDPTDPENLTKLSGRGLLLIRTFMDEVHFNAAGNEITMVKRRARV
jgi:CheY-like chemotaxis protein